MDTLPCFAQPRVERAARLTDRAEAPCAQAPRDWSADLRQRCAGQPSGREPAQSPRAVEPRRPTRDMSPWSMFLSADILVKAVMICLAIASLVTWTIFLAMTCAPLPGAAPRAQAPRPGSPMSRRLSEAQLALGSKRHVVSFAARCRHQRDPHVGRQPDRGRHQGARRITLLRRSCALEARARPAGHGRAGDDRVGFTVRGPVRDGLGHHEQLHRDFQSRRRRTLPSLLPASPRRCSRPRLVSSPPSRPLSSTTTLHAAHAAISTSSAARPA